MNGHCNNNVFGTEYRVTHVFEVLDYCFDTMAWKKGLKLEVTDSALLSSSFDFRNWVFKKNSLAPVKRSKANKLSTDEWNEWFRIILC